MWPSEVRAALKRGSLRAIDVAPILGVSKHRVGQLAQRDETPRPRS